MIGAKVDVRKRWGYELARRINAGAERAVREASEEGARVASSASSSRRRTGRMAAMDVLDVVGTGDGWEGGFRSSAFYAPFQSKGTKTGITPLRFLEKGRTEARNELVERLNRLERR